MFICKKCKFGWNKSQWPINRLSELFINNWLFNQSLQLLMLPVQCFIFYSVSVPEKWREIISWGKWFSKKQWLPYTFSVCCVKIDKETLECKVCRELCMSFLGCSCVHVHICMLWSGSMHVCAPMKHLCRRAYTSILCVYFHSYGFLLARTDVGETHKIRAEAAL